MKESFFLDYLTAAALALYIFMGANLILAKTPKRDLYIPYKTSKLLVGIAFLLIGLNIAVLWLGQTAQWQEHFIIVSDILNDYIIYILLTIASINLFKHDYLNKTTIRRQATGLLVIIAISALSILVTPNSRWIPQRIGTAWLFGYMIWFIGYFHNVIEQTRNKMAYYHNHELTRYMRWVIRSVVLWIVFGLVSTFISLAPTWGKVIFRIYGIAINSYIYASLRNYLIHYETVEQAIMEVRRQYSNRQKIPRNRIQEARDKKIEQGVQVWLQMNGFTQTGITIDQLALQIGTNRSYLSYYINQTYATKFNDWLNQLRLEHAKNTLRTNKSLSMEEVALRSGFSSGSYFTKIFVKSTGKPPMKWKEHDAKSHIESLKQQ